MQPTEQQTELEKAKKQAAIDKERQEQILRQKLANILGKEPKGSLEPVKKSDNRLVQKYYDSQNFRIFLTFVLLVMLFATTLFLSYVTIMFRPKHPTNFTECSQLKGSVIQESYPAVCVTKNGKRFIQKLSDEEKGLLKAGFNEGTVKGTSDYYDFPASVFSTCLENNQQLFEEIAECESISERKCVELKAEFDICVSSCRKELGRNECYLICKPVCEAKRPISEK